MVECLQCIQTFETDDELTRHYRLKHIRGWWRWCGWAIDPGMDAWCDHIKREGGLIAHYLACHLGEVEHG